VFLYSIAQDMPNFFFHTAAVPRSAAFQAHFHSLFEMTHDEQGHSQILLKKKQFDIMMISLRPQVM